MQREGRWRKTYEKKKDLLFNVHTGKEVNATCVFIIFSIRSCNIIRPIMTKKTHFWHHYHFLSVFFFYCIINKPTAIPTVLLWCIPYLQHSSMFQYWFCFHFSIAIYVTRAPICSISKNSQRDAFIRFKDQFTIWEQWSLFFPVDAGEQFLP